MSKPLKYVLRLDCAQTPTATSSCTTVNLVFYVAIRGALKFASAFDGSSVVQRRSFIRQIRPRLGSSLLVSEFLLVAFI